MLQSLYDNLHKMFIIKLVNHIDQKHQLTKY
jgi:hypothetical protein